MTFSDGKKQTWGVALLALLLESCKVTGVDPNDSLYNETQAETAINISNVNGATHISVAYNTPEKPGGGQWIGYSYWDGQAWLHRRNLPLPAGWITRPDPSMTKVPGQEQFVFLASLGTRADERTGVCVWRSSNAGRDFELWQCIPPGDSEYDGSSLTAGADGRIYLASFADSVGRIDVFRADSVNSPFTQLSSTPFPGFGIRTHPRLHVQVVPDLTGPTAYVLWVVAGTNQHQLVANGYYPNNNAWGTPKVIASDLAPYDSLGIQLPNGAFIRMGPQFSYDVGYDDVSTFEATLRAAFTRRTADNRYYVRGARCTIPGPDRGQLGACTEEPGWASDAGGAGASGDQWGPLVAWHGRIFGPNNWVLSYSSRQDNPTGSSVAFWGGRLRRGLAFAPAREFDPKDLCGGGLLWGDYDDIRFFATNADGVDLFLRTHTDSTVGVSRGCANQGALGDHHVSIALVN